MHLIAANRTEQTIETRTEHLRRLARHHPAGPDAFTADDWEAWSAAHQWSTESRRSYTASVRTFFAWYNHSDPTASTGPIRPAEPIPRPIPEDQLRIGLRAADSRTEQILRLAAEAGLRRAEIARIEPAQQLIPALPGGLPLLLVIGKGRKPRLVPLPASLAASITRTAADGRRYLFPGPSGHLTPRHVGALARAVLPPPWTLHTLRHRFAVHAYADHDLLAVQLLLGHASPATTRRYIPTTTEQLMIAARHAHLV